MVQILFIYDAIESLSFHANSFHFCNNWFFLQTKIFCIQYECQSKIPTQYFNVVLVHALIRPRARDTPGSMLFFFALKQDNRDVIFSFGLQYRLKASFLCIDEPKRMYD